MNETKYGKYIIQEPINKATLKGSTQSIHISAEAGSGGAIFSDFPADFGAICITEPLEMSMDPHTHDYDQLLCFIGGNPLNFFEFGAEIELALGEECEKHLINTTSIVYIPKGLIHCPLEFKKVSAPVLFMHVCFAPEYSRVGDTQDQPKHSERKKFSLDEILKLRGLK